MKNHLQNINHNITQRGEEGTGNDRESNFDKGASGAVAQGADTRGFYGVVLGKVCGRRIDGRGGEARMSRTGYSVSVFFYKGRAGD